MDQLIHRRPTEIQIHDGIRVQFVSGEDLLNQLKDISSRLAALSGDPGSTFTVEPPVEAVRDSPAPRMIEASSVPKITPMRLLRIPEPFDDDDFIFEPKLDGFRALAHVEGDRP